VPQLRSETANRSITWSFFVSRYSYSYLRYWKRRRTCKRLALFRRHSSYICVCGCT